MSVGCKPLNDNEIFSILNRLSSLRDKSLFLLGLKTGFRISELLSIKIKDCIQYNTIKDVITVDRRNTKGKHSSRSIPLNNDLKNTLQAYIETLPSEQVYLFESQKGNKLSRIQAWRVIHSAAIQAKIKGKVATHSMRKSFALKVYIASERDLVLTSEMLGHININNTKLYLKFYTNEDLNNLILKAMK